MSLTIIKSFSLLSRPFSNFLFAIPFQDYLAPCQPLDEPNIITRLIHLSILPFGFYQNPTQFPLPSRRNRRKRGALYALPRTSQAFCQNFQIIFASLDWESGNIMLFSAKELILQDLIRSHLISLTFMNFLLPT